MPGRLKYVVSMVKPLRTTGKKRTKGTSPCKAVKFRGKKPFRSYKEAIGYLFAQTGYEKQEHLRYNISTFSLKRMEKLLSLLGNPHRKIHTAHIAGTKGKGSTATMLAKMLEANNYKVGLYTSPHVVHLHERIMVNSEMNSESEMGGRVNRIH